MSGRVATTPVSSGEELQRDLDRQVETLLVKGYPERAGLSEDAFLEGIAPLRSTLPDADGRPRFVLVTRELVPPHEAITLVELASKSGFTSMEADDLARFEPIDGVELPRRRAYLLTDVDTGRDTLNVTPDDALDAIVRAGRSPLTIDEGIALITHYPDILKTQNCFSMLGSRCGDRRVTALWLSTGRPRLGWCWAGNPHTWLGSASCGSRIGA